MSITQTKLKEYLNYNPITGNLTWRKRPSKNIHLHTRAGTLDKNGYRYISLLGKRYPEHRLIWCLVHGQFPDGDIDHINQIRDDNRLDNLRVVSKADNARNRTRRDSRLDEVGIWWCRTRKRYVAEITKNGKKVYQKSFTDIDEAIKQRKLKSIELGFHDNHGQTKSKY